MRQRQSISSCTKESKNPAAECITANTTIYCFYNNKMANIYRPNYDPSINAGTSGAEVSDLRPEQAYDTDLRRLDPEERSSAESVNDNQERVGKFMRAAKTAGAYKQRASIDEPMINGRTPRAGAQIDGVELPTRGDSGGRTGTVGYARSPKPQFGKPFV
jgi:hypothetical protein